MPEGGRNPFLSFLLSFFLPGLGQAYNGDHLRAGCFLGGFVALFYSAGGYLLSFPVAEILSKLAAYDLFTAAYLVFWVFSFSEAFLSAYSPSALEEEEDVSGLDSLIEGLG